MRLFIAIELPAGVREELGRRMEALAKVQAPIRWTKPENLHLTIKFLGEVGEKEVVPLSEALAGVGEFGPIRLWARGLEFFPPRGPMRVVAVGLDGDLAALAKLKDQIEQVCTPLGFEPEGRAFQPHVTIGRVREMVKSKIRLELILAGEQREKGRAFEVRQFVLMESRLGAGGAQYGVVGRFEE